MGTIIDFLLNMQFKAIEIFTYFPKLTLKISSPSIFGILLYYLILFIILVVLELKN